MFDYQWEKLYHSGKVIKRISSFKPKYGPNVIKKHSNDLVDVEFNVPVNNFDDKLYIVGEFNDWGKKNVENFELKNNNNSARIKLEKLNANESYLFQVGKSFFRDPASNYFDSEGNSVIYNHTYKFKYKKPNSFNRSVKVLQTDLAGLITHYKNTKGKKGSQITTNNTYKFITESGVLEYIKKLGFNYIQFLPVTQSIDGDKWSFRYLTPFLYAVDKRWGTPDDFKGMIDEMHRNGIGFIMDFVISHIPFRDYKIFNLRGEDVGIHLWEKISKGMFGEETPWGTMRYNFNNSQTQDFLINAALNFVKNYKIDGFRIDNVDGILRYGTNGDGPERPGSRDFLRKFNQTLYDYDPGIQIFYESHYFHGNNSKWLVQPISESPMALGATAYTSSRLTYYLHTDFMPKSADDISPWRVKQIKEEEEWGKSSSTIADFHNHDAAAGLMVNRATGSYAYDALILGNPDLHFHAVGKIKVMEAIISLAYDGRSLDLLQTHILQLGTFEHDNSIHWELLKNEVNSQSLNFKKRINEIMEHKAFWPINVKNRQFINVDEDSKSLTLVRKGFSERERFLIHINMSAAIKENYIIPAPENSKFKLKLNSDEIQYGGTGESKIPLVMTPEKTDNFQYFDKGIRLDKVPPYAVLVWWY